MSEAVVTFRAAETAAIESLATGQDFDEKSLQRARKAAEDAVYRERLEQAAADVAQRREAQAAKQARVKELLARHDEFVRSGDARRERLYSLIESLAKTINEEFKTDDEMTVLRHELEDLGVSPADLPGVFRAKEYMGGQSWTWSDRLTKTITATNHVTLNLPVSTGLY